MTTYTATFKLGDKTITAVAATPQNLRREMRAVAERLGFKHSDISDAKFFGDTGRLRREDVSVIIVDQPQMQAAVA